MEKLLPQSIEAEQGVLGSIIIDPDAVSLVEPFLHADDFYWDAHRTLYEAIIHLHAASPVVHAHSQYISRKPRPGSAYLCEIAQVKGWRIRRCDAINLLLFDSLDEHDPLRHDLVIVFTPREYRMLVPLLEQMDQPVPFAALIDGPFDIRRDLDLFRTHMARVRKKIAHLGIVIRPVKGYGYLAQVE